MKRVVVSVCAVVGAFVAIPVFAVGQADGKNDCLTYGRNCPSAVDSLPERIATLKTEIAKGEKVYSPEELRLFDQKLKESNETMRVLHRPR